VSDDVGDKATRGDEAPTSDATEGPATTSRASSSEDGASGKVRDEAFDLKGIVRQLTAPMIESLDTRLRDQIEAHVDELLDDKVERALADRLRTVDRAIADLSRSIAELEQRVVGDGTATT
jgi:hypothetical protein